MERITFSWNGYDHTAWAGEGSPASDGSVVPRLYMAEQFAKNGIRAIIAHDKPLPISGTAERLRIERVTINRLGPVRRALSKIGR